MAADTQLVKHTLYGPFIFFGCDPELFIEDANGEIVGAERIIPPNVGKILGGRVALDGVQLELHPDAQMCRANLGNSIQYIFQDLKARLQRPEYAAKGYKICFRTTVEVSKKEHASLSPATRMLGCMPSLNVYRRDAKITVNPLTYRKRSAGGHIHMGSLPFHEKMKKDREIAARFVRILDVLVGNTCAMVDRDKDAALRRRNYGRAGEYRLPSHGVEYRVLSNFWLRSYQLFGMVTGLCRLAAGVMSATFGDNYSLAWDAENALLDLVDRDNIVKAINTNDFDLAKANFDRIKPFFRAHVPHSDSGLWDAGLDNFDLFTQRIQEKGIEYWFPEDPLEHWCSKPEGHGTGWETFLQNVNMTDQARQTPSNFTIAAA